MKFSIRDLFWLTLVVALLLAWLSQFFGRLRDEDRNIGNGLKLNALKNSMYESGYEVSIGERPSFVVTISPPLPMPTSQAPAPTPSKP
jgi:hypothetical protein